MAWMLQDDVEAAAVKDLYSSSDRAAAILAATIVEARLTEAIKSRFTRDKKKETELFRSSGALGAFSSKIKLARLMGICSEAAYSDLDTMKNIRNQFAHDLDVRDFESQRIEDLCKNFRLIEMCVQEATKGELPNPNWMATLMGIENRVEKLTNPKWRYLLTAMLFSGSLHLRRTHGRPNI